MEKGLVILLLSCAGAFVADSMPTEEQRRVLELLQQELAAEKQGVGFPTNPVEQQMRNQQIENAVEQQTRNQQIENAVEQQMRNQQIEEQQILSAKQQRVGFPTNPVEQQIQNAKEQQSTNNGVVYTRWGTTECLLQPYGSTMEELLEPTTLMQVRLLTISACHTTQNITTPLRKQLMLHMSMDQSTKHGAVQKLILPTTMSPVLCTMQKEMQ